MPRRASEHSARTVQASGTVPWRRQVAGPCAAGRSTPATPSAGRRIFAAPRPSALLPDVSCPPSCRSRPALPSTASDRRGGVKVRPQSCTASLVAGGLVSMSQPANASTYFQGGSFGFLVPVLAKIISCLQRQFLVGPELLIQLPDALGVDDANLPLRRWRQFRHVLRRVHVQPADEDTVDRLETVSRCTPLGAAPDGVAGGLVLSSREDQRHVERHAGGRQFFQAPGRPAWPAP